MPGIIPETLEYDKLLPVEKFGAIGGAVIGTPTGGGVR